MATVVWHSCSDQQNAELLPPQPPLTALRLKLVAPQKPADQLGGWKFLIPSLPLNTTDDVTPPSVVKVKLSDKSLEMCTENLGCETGITDVISSGDVSDTPNYIINPLSVNDDDSKSPTTRQQSVWGRKVNNAAGRSGCFPPPLTTMRCGGERVVLVRSHKEGRLVVDAVECPYSSRSNFVTHRSSGRLRLSLPLLRSDDQLEETDELKKTDTTLVDENHFRQSLDINIREKNRHIIRDEELVDEKEEEEAESTAGRFQRLPAMSRCMEAGGEHEHRHRHHRHHHHHHHRKQFINVRLNWVATS